MWPFLSTPSTHSPPCKSRCCIHEIQHGTLCVLRLNGFNQGHLSDHEFGMVYWSPTGSWVFIQLRECLSRAQNLSLAISLMEGIQASWVPLLPISTWLLTGPVLLRCTAGKCNCVGFMVRMCVACPEDSSHVALVSVVHPLSSFCPFFPSVPWASMGDGVTASFIAEHLLLPVTWVQFT